MLLIPLLPYEGQSQLYYNPAQRATKTEQADEVNVRDNDNGDGNSNEKTMTTCILAATANYLNYAHCLVAVEGVSLQRFQDGD